MNLIKIIAIILCIFISINTGAENKLQIHDKGMDGNQRGYLVTCKNGEIGSIINHFQISESSKAIPKRRDDMPFPGGGDSNSEPIKLIKTCIATKDGGQKCQRSWDLRSAAIASCSQ